MGVYIPNMEMPKACVKCRFCTAFECFASGEYIKDHYKRNDDCPLVEIPAPHGRLIDADALEDKMDTYGVSYSNLKRAPTIIEAEGKDDG